MLDITLNGVSIEADASVYQKGKGIIVDSGTTDTYLPKSVARGFSKAWEATTGSVRNSSITVCYVLLFVAPGVRVRVSSRIIGSIFVLQCR